MDYKDYLFDVKGFIANNLSYDSPFVKDIVSKIPYSSGKMTRSLILYSLSKISSDIDENIRNKAVLFGSIIEILHLATIVHDDVIDDSSQRRGSLTLNKAETNRISILAGDILFSTSFKLMAAQNDNEITKIIANACEDVVCGEIEEEILISNSDIQMQDYLTIIDKKTARLFEISAEIGSIIANSNLVEKAKIFGKNIGIAFQIIDDLIDYFSTEKDSGKPQFSDIKTKKFTIPVIMLKQYATQDEMNTVNQIFTNKNHTASEDDINAILALMNKYEIKSKIIDESEKYVNLAKDALLTFNDSKDRSIMLQFLNEISYRNK
ncbi:polyprenyl synthetase family protein [Candidatus Deianiraea vastatrix]|uniref:Octaprenyl-diphosphate synthase n=1 Tax=Candidatus Deianiraea vastatrix TaxID=2163644 RepID=A0A5B8XBV2_9RICK|nr:polyprenyl synthetase family protein [Candidatus Deianiraea vastatrix]QED22833.1 Octaprenyl-diphosphate synthase [Candidatus Deianiraea vastatrix]